VKKLICAAPGVKEESEWEDSYEGIAGGIVTVRSELGEPIHNVACRGLKTWRQFDKKYFLQPRDKRAALIAADKDWIISQLNANYQKPYFGRKADGSVCDLPDMTYAEVLRRLVQLMYVTEPKGEWPEEDLQKYRFKRPRWIDVTYESRTFKVRKKSHVHLPNAMQFICARMLEYFARAITGASCLLPLLPTRLFSSSFLRDVLVSFLLLVFMLMRARR
jgi:enoyl reductase-like protein